MYIVKKKMFVVKNGFDYFTCVQAVESVDWSKWSGASESSYPYHSLGLLVHHVLLHCLNRYIHGVSLINRYLDRWKDIKRYLGKNINLLPKKR